MRRVAGFLGPFLVLVPGLAALFRSVRVQLSFHGYLHSAYVYEILNGRLPPENPLIAGEPANEYWLFHGLLALVSYATRIPPPLAAAFVNVVSLAAAVAAIYWILGLLRLTSPRPIVRAMTALLVLFGLNLFGAVHAAAAQITGSSAAGDVMNLDPMVLAGAARSAGLFAKFLNFNGFPLGAALFLFALGCAVRLTKEVSVPPVSGFVAAGVAAVAFHPTTGLFALAVLPVSLALTWVWARDLPAWRMTVRQTVAVAGAALVGLVAVGLYVNAVREGFATGVTLGGVGDNTARFFAVTYPLLPFASIGAAAALRRGHSELVMLACVGVLGGVVACTAVLPGGNQYKFDYLVAFALALLAISGWCHLFDRVRGPALATAAVAVAALLSSQLYIGINYLRSDWMDDETIAYEGIDVVGRSPAERSTAWEWIRENTATDVVVVVPPMNKDRARFLAISQRLAYAVEGGPLTEGNPEFESRIDIVRTIYSPESTTDWIAALDRIAEDVGADSVIVATTTERQSEAMESPPMRPLFRGTGVVNLYELTGD